MAHQRTLKYLVSISILVIVSLAHAKSPEEQNSSGSVSTSVDALDKEGFECASREARPYLLQVLPKFFLTNFAKDGVLDEEGKSEYKMGIILDKNAMIVGYDLALESDEDSKLVQSILKHASLPMLPKSALCLVGKAYVYTFTLE